MRLIVNGKAYLMRRAEGPAVQALAKLLPLSLEMEELNGNEKCVYLGEHLPSAARCPGVVHAGDLMLFGSNCLVLFYQTFRTRYAYTPIGRLEESEGLPQTLGQGNVRVVLE